MIFSFPVKSAIYLLALVPLFFRINMLNALGSPLLVLIVQLLALGAHLWMTYAIHNDAKNRGLNENWYLPQLIAGPLGLVVYWIKILGQEPRK